MDRLRRLFGVGRESTDEKKQQNTDSRLHPELTEHSDNTGRTDDAQKEILDTRIKTAFNKVETSLRKVIPIREGDCLSCKLIGTTGCFAGSVYTVYCWNQWENRYTGYKRIFVNVGVLSFAAYLDIEENSE